MGAAPPRRAYYAHVEGLRGVAALYVFLYHIWQYGTAPAAGPRLASPTIS